MGLFGGWGGSVSGGTRRGLLALDNLELLQSGLIGRIDLESTSKLRDGAPDISALLEDTSAIEVADGGLKLHALEVGLVPEVLGSLERSLAIILEGGIVILPVFGGLTFFAPGTR